MNKTFLLNIFSPDIQFHQIIQTNPTNKFLGIFFHKFSRIPKLSPHCVDNYVRWGSANKMHLNKKIGKQFEAN
jgi:hypothetical protein